MTLFSDPAYIALCRELRLAREWVDGDYFIDDEPERVLGGVRFAARVSEVQIQGRATWGDSETACEHSIWLPRLDQWLAMLEEAGVTSMLWKRLASNGWWRLYPNPTRDEYGVVGTFADRDGLMTAGPTQEEAAARLWCAVTGRMVSG